jgi:isobutyryl-CoA mutase
MQSFLQKLIFNGRKFSRRFGTKIKNKISLPKNLCQRLYWELLELVVQEKSSMIDEIVRRFLFEYPEKRIAILSVDPSKRKTGGALLGDRIRMNSINDARVFMRSLATRQSNLALSKYVNEAVEILKLATFDLIILETSGIGQSDTEIVDHSDVSMYIMTPEFGAASQLEKKSIC